MNKFRILLLPLSIIYGWILWLRNIAYRYNLLKSQKPDVKTIVVGNLSLGGTGKTPHLEYLLNLLKDENLAVLSRGYGRKSTGTQKVTLKSTADEVGDEPLQMAQNFPNKPFVVDELRVRGIEKIKEWYPNTNLVLLDDAMQHRKLQAGFHILLTTWNEPFFKDHYLPTGNLRDHKTRATDADVIIVTKCPAEIEHKTKMAYLKKLFNFCPNVFFDRIDYGPIVPLNEDDSTLTLGQKVLLITGIAKPQLLKEKVESSYELIEHLDYRDHHIFSAKDIEKVRNIIGRFAPGEIAIVTTEKDTMRLKPFADSTAHEPLPIYYWKIGVQFEQNQEEFDKLIFEYVSRT